jgi:hypothetical protein
MAYLLSRELPTINNVFSHLSFYLLALLCYGCLRVLKIFSVVLIPKKKRFGVRIFLGFFPEKRKVLRIAWNGAGVEWGVSRGSSLHRGPPSAPAAFSYRISSVNLLLAPHNGRFLSPELSDWADSFCIESGVLRYKFIVPTTLSLFLFLFCFTYFSPRGGYPRVLKFRMGF